ncbi:MAG: ComEA family DNA-binding protein [Ruminococcaceae bacterium]|nr:ComEA family DNA-binding protein [Oscillospiraceae bacterium]
MKTRIAKFKPFLYPAAFVLIAGFAFAYKIVLKGNIPFEMRTVRGGEVVMTSGGTVPGSYVTETTSATAAPSGTETTSSVSTVQVYLCGAVRNPGVYTVISGTILNEAVEKAGGFTSDAAVTSMNLVYEINSNMSFYIPTVKEVESGKADGTDIIRGKGTFIWGAESGSSKSQAKVNINTADKITLQTLPGIGEATAGAIIEYRNKTPFKTIEDLKNVSGIGDAKFERVKEFITV